MKVIVNCTLFVVLSIIDFLDRIVSFNFLFFFLFGTWLVFRSCNGFILKNGFFLSIYTGVFLFVVVLGLFLFASVSSTVAVCLCVTYSFCKKFLDLVRYCLFLNVEVLLSYYLIGFILKIWTSTWP